MNRRVVISVVSILAMTAGLTACMDDAPVPAVGQNVSDVNGIQDQNENETVQAYNNALKNPANRYPAREMSNPLELQMLKERDLFLNDANKLQYIYIFPSGRNEVFFSSVRGKVSSMASEMIATDGVYGSSTCSNSCGGGNVVVPIPQDDLSYGGTEFGDNGIFWFDEQGGFHEAGTAGATVMIESAPLKLSAIELPAQAMDPKILAKLNSK